MSRSVGARISEKLYKQLEEEMVRKGYLSISETIRVILRDNFKEQKLHDSSPKTPEAEKAQRIPAH